MIGTSPTALLIAQSPDPSSPVLAEHLDQIVEEILALDISVLEGRKDEMLNWFPNDWPSIARLIDSRLKA